jgi:hypothetical protein
MSQMTGKLKLLEHKSGFLLYIDIYTFPVPVEQKPDGPTGSSRKQRKLCRIVSLDFVHCLGVIKITTFQMLVYR